MQVGVDGGRVDGAWQLGLAGRPRLNQGRKLGIDFGRLVEYELEEVKLDGECEGPGPNSLRIWLLDTETAEISDLAALNDGNRGAGHTELRDGSGHMAVEGGEAIITQPERHHSSEVRRPLTWWLGHRSLSTEGFEFVPNLNYRDLDYEVVGAKQAWRCRGACRRAC
jgi:hypothetical protein